MNEKQLSEIKKTRAAFKRVFTSKDGQIVKKQFATYKMSFIDFAMDCKETAPQTMAINQASGVDGILKMIDEAIRIAEFDEKKAKEEAAKQKD